MSAPVNPRHENLQLRVWEGANIPTGLLCLEPGCNFNSGEMLERSHFISKSMLYAIGNLRPTIGSDGKVQASADSSSPFWTRLLLCDKCEKKQGEGSLDNLRCRIRTDIAKNKRNKAKTIRLFVSEKDAAQDRSWLYQVNAIRDCIDVSPMQLTPEHDFLFSKLIWRCRLKQSCERELDYSIEELHKWPLEEDYVVWVDMGEPLDGVVPLDQPFGESPEDFKSTLEYMLRFTHCIHDKKDYIKVGHVHIMTSHQIAAFGFDGVTPKTVLFCSAPSLMRDFLIHYRLSFALEVDRVFDGTVFRTLARAMRGDGYDAPDENLNAEELRQALYQEEYIGAFRKYMGVTD